VLSNAAFAGFFSAPGVPNSAQGVMALEVASVASQATALYLGDNIDDALAAREAGVPFAAIIALGEHNYRKRAAKFRQLGSVALLPRATALDGLLKKEGATPRP